MKNQKIKIGLINCFNEKGRKEVNALLDMFKNEKHIQFREITLESVKTKFLHKKYDILWWHNPDMLVFPEIANDEDVQDYLVDYVIKGGNVILSLLAGQYVYDLGLEEKKPDKMFMGAWDKDPWIKSSPDIRGFHSYLGHSLFNGLHNGVYTWNPQPGEEYCECYYSEETVPDETAIGFRKTAAIGREYFAFEEKAKMINEYDIEKGKILTIGSYLFYSAKSKRFKSELKKFTLNCIDYLKNRTDEEDNTYWHEKEFDIMKLQNRKTKSGFKIFRGKIASGEYSFTNKSTENFFDLTGRRTLVMGRELGKISEIWFHPFRALRNYKFSIMSGDGKIVRDKELKSSFYSKPESVKREYSFREGKINEMIFTALNIPGVVVDYNFDIKTEFQALVEFKIDLRLMWPYPPSVLGPIKYYWDEGLNCLVISNDDDRFYVHFGSSLKPEEIITGRYSSLSWNNENLSGIDTDEKYLLVGLRFAFKNNNSLRFVISGSNAGMKESFETCKELMNNTGKYYREHSDYYNSLLKNTTVINTPDKEFNEGYKWSVIGMDKFYANTPPLGFGLQAGYANTKPGWADGRPGYAWYFGRDSIWAAMALLKYGDFEKAKNVIRLLSKYQNIDGKIFHELTASGCVHYDAADSTPLYVILCGYYLRHTGDIKFIKDNWQSIKSAMDFMYSTDTDADLLIENKNVGHGWIEDGKLSGHLTETYLAACWAEALKEASCLAERLDIGKLAKKYDEDFQSIKNKINTAFWINALQFYSVGKFENEAYNLEKTALISVPLLFNHSETQKALKVLYEYAGNNFSTDWGVRLIREDNKIFNPKSPYSGAVWPLITGWVSMAEYRYFRGVQGFTHLMENLSMYKHWSKGYIPDVLNGEEFIPDGVTSHHAMSEAMVLQPILQGMLGFNILNENELELSPNLPAMWETAEAYCIRAGKSTFDFKYHRTQDKYIFEFAKKGPKALKIHFKPFLLKGMNIKNILINKKPVKTEVETIDNNSGYILNFLLKDKIKIEITYSGGVMALPVISKIKPGMKSKGMKIIKDEFINNEYKILLEGKRENNYTFCIYSNMRIKSVDGAKLLGKSGKLQNLSVDFEDAKDKYYNKEIVLKF